MKRYGFAWAGRMLLLCSVLIPPLLCAGSARAAADLPVYADALASGWEDWSYGGVTVNAASTASVHAGANAISVAYTGGWSGFQLGYHSANLDVSAYDTFRFWIHGGSGGGQNIVVQIGDLEQAVTPQANTWTRVDVSLLSLGSPRSVYSIAWFNNTAGSHAAFYLDDIAFVDNGTTTTSTTTPPPETGPALSIDAASDQHAISPYIYGMNYAGETIAADLRLPVRRWGGNAVTRYNWQNGFTNTGSDWYYENVPGNSADDFVSQDRRTGTKTLLTMPLIGWVAKSSPSSHPYNCGYKISKYGSQQDADWAWDPDCGNGVSTNGSDIAGNDPLDTSVAVTASYATGWVNHLIATFGTAAGGGVQFYNLDNEPMLWNSTHRDIHPSPATYDELRDQTWAYAAAIKAADPGGQTLGPVVWGWCAYFYSAADGCAAGPDRQAHGNTDFVEWYLQQMSAYEQQHGVRILDYVDVHIYPQVNGVYSDSLGSASVQAARLRSTRQLWDATYVHEGWIGQPVYLIPRMKQWVAGNYPGTKLAITEYNWGALGHLNGALAQADLLGIFGREGLDLATLWGPPGSAQDPGIFAFRMYRNYDGQGSAFGDSSVRAASADQEQLAVYAARHSPDNALTLIMINKTGQGLTSDLALAGFQAGTAAHVYRYSSANLAAIVSEPDQAVTAGGFSATYPANSITLMVVPAASSATSTTTTAAGSTTTAGSSTTTTLELASTTTTAAVQTTTTIAPLSSTTTTAVASTTTTSSVQSTTTTTVPACTVRIIPKNIGWFIGEKKRIRLLFIIGPKESAYDESTAVSWNTAAIETLHTWVLLKRFMLMTVRIDGSRLDKGDYTLSVDSCTGTVHMVR